MNLWICCLKDKKWCDLDNKKCFSWEARNLIIWKVSNNAILSDFIVLIAFGVACVTYLESSKWRSRLFNVSIKVLNLCMKIWNSPFLEMNGIFGKFACAWKVTVGWRLWQILYVKERKIHIWKVKGIVFTLVLSFNVVFLTLGASLFNLGYNKCMADLRGFFWPIYTPLSYAFQQLLMN